MAGTPSPRPSWRTRLGWLVLLWAAGVVALALVAGALRLFMGMAGLSR